MNTVTFRTLLSFKQLVIKIRGYSCVPRTEKLLKEEKKVELVIINMSNSFIDIYSDK